MKSKVFTISKAFALCSGFFVLLGLASCRENNYLNPDLAPGIGSDNAIELDKSNLDLQFKLHVFDSMNTSNTSMPYGAIGSLDGDPFYGNISAGMNIQFTLPRINYEFPENMEQIDSVVLVIPYLQIVYGDSTSKLAVDVFEITDPSFKIDTSFKKYYAFTDVAYTPTSIGNYQGDLRSLRTDSLYYPNSTDTLTNQLSIKLSSSMVEKFKNMTTSNTANQDAFTSFLKGLYIAPRLSAGAEFKKGLFYFQYFNTSNTAALQGARLEVHYTTTNTEPHGYVTFPYSSKYSAFYTKVKREYSSSPSAPYYLANGSNIDTLLITGGPGLYTELEIGGLSQISSKDMVNLARLEFNVKKTAETSLYQYPNQLLISGVLEDGTQYVIQDYGTDPTVETSNGISVQNNLAIAFVGGEATEKTIDGVDYINYTLNFPRAVQRAVLAGSDKMKIRIYPLLTLPGAYRLMAPGFNDASNAKAQFKIIYSKL